MDEQLAKIVIAAGAATGLGVWIVVLQLYRKMTDAPTVEVLETPVRDKSPAEAMKLVVATATQWAGSVRLERPSESELQIHQLRCDTRIVARRAGGQTMLTAEVDDTKLRRTSQRWLALFVLLLMPVTIVGLAWALWHYAAPSAAPGARTQAVQIVQIVHVLWPPFLIYGLWKSARTTNVNAASNLLVVAAA
jgi:hypothetical protein